MSEVMDVGLQDNDHARSKVTTSLVNGVHRSAEVSDCGKYRWWLRRSWNASGENKHVSFLMLNPSTADGLEDDPTIRRCIGFAQKWGCNSLSVRNIFAYRSSKPELLLEAIDPTGGPRGDMELMAAFTGDFVVAAWGANDTRTKLGRLVFERVEYLMRTIPEGAKSRIQCLGVTQAGCPRHPLYVPKSTPLGKWLERE